MKAIVAFGMVFCFAACFAVQSLALPGGNPEGDQFVNGGLEPLTKIEPELHGRYKRATCDLLSAAGVSHTTYAAHCLLIGFHGGYCNGKAICLCRN